MGSREGWKWRLRQGRGGGREYHLSSLPPETRVALMKRDGTAAPVAVPALAAPVAAAAPTARPANQVVSFFPKAKPTTTPSSPAAIAAPDLPAHHMESVPNQAEIDADVYDRAPDYQRRKANKYLLVLQASEGLFGRALESFVDSWNAEHPDLSTSYPAILRARETVASEGRAGLLAKWGNRRGGSTIDQPWFEFFSNHYLQEQRPSLAHVWRMTFGFATHETKQITLENFPSVVAFWRLLSQRFDEGTIYRARYGYSAWKRKFEAHIVRDYESLPAGEAWVSDHAQIDVLTTSGDRVAAPWLTAWRCLKTGKFLGWHIHVEPPNSDHIFQAFYRAALAFGLPKHVLIDNGKDYRSRDFAGGRTTLHKVQVDEAKASPMLLLLNVQPHFAIPYNAQTKPIERDFLKIKEWFSKTFPGYRGGDVIERPERLAEEVKGRRLVSFEELKAGLEGFITKVLNCLPSQGRALRGRSPDMAWGEEFVTRREVRRDALKLFCMRASNPVKIGRNGVRDSRLDSFYWGEWMAGRKGDLVYMRRDPDSWQDAWVFDAKDDSYIAQATLVRTVPVLAASDVDRQTLNEESARKGREKKLMKARIKSLEATSSQEQQFYLETAVSALAASAGKRLAAAGSGPAIITGAGAASPQIPTASSPAKIPMVQLANTKMDRVVTERARQDQDGKGDLAKIVPIVKPKKKLYALASDRDADERESQRQQEEDR